MLLISVYYLFADKNSTERKEAFRVKRIIAKKLAKRKKKIRNRVEKRNWPEQPRPMLGGGNICYDVDGRHEAISYGGVGSIHQLALRSGLIAEINDRLDLLKRHLPYHESDHVLNIAYNFLTGGSCGHRLAGLGSESLVRPAFTLPPLGPIRGAHGVQALPEHLYPAVWQQRHGAAVSPSEPRKGWQPIVEHTTWQRKFEPRRRAAPLTFDFRFLWMTT